MTRNFIDPTFAISVTVALCAAMSRKRKPRIVSEAEIGRAQESAKREDWNRTVAARKAAKLSAKSAPATTGKDA